ncbi:MAG: TonB-dependent receptor [Cypionkella sp.]|nr:TonB-dependent receptor [Cypionkella sp.]
MTLRALLLCSLSVAALLPAAARAQTTTTELDPVLVIDTGTESPAGTAPAGTAPATTVTADEIAQRQAGSLSDVLRGVPGVATNHAGNLLATNPSIRGFGGGGHMASDPSVQITLDGASTDGGRVYQNITSMLADPALMKSVTVLKGPLASLEYGSGITGGTVAMETITGADLTGDTPGFRFRQLLGANSNGKGWVTSSTLGWQPNDKLDVLFNYTRRAQGRQKDGDGAPIALDGFNVPSTLFKARYRIDAANSVTLSYTQSESSERDVPYGQLSGSAIFGNVNRDREGTVASVAWNYTPDDNALMDLELKYSRSTQQIDIVALDPSSFAARLFAGTFDLQTDRLTLKNTARFSTGSIDHTLRTGLDLSRQSRDTLNGSTPSGEADRVGVFAINEMAFGPDLTVTAGLRLERQTIEGQTSTGTIGPFDTTARTAGIGFEQALGQGFSAFGALTYGEGLASLDVFASRSASRGVLYGTDVQKSRTVEAGLKYSGNSAFIAGDTLSGSVTVYHTQVRDALYGVATSGEYPGFKMRGLEAELRYALDSGLYAQGAVSINNHSELFYSAAGAYAWRDFLYTPANSATITLGKTFDTGWDLSWTLRAADSITLDRGTVTRKAGWGVHDISVRYAPDEGALAGLSVDFGIENVFDRKYTDNLATQPEAGRNVKLTIAKTF